MEILDYCRKAEIFDIEDNLICDAVVFRDSAERLQLIVPTDFPTIPAGSAAEYKILFYDPMSGLLDCRCTLSQPLKMSTGRLSILCEVEEVLETVQRRQDLKVPIEVEVEVRGVSAPPGFDLTDKPFTGLTRNVSAGGIYFSCELPIISGTILELRLTLTNKPLVLQARVLRQEELPPKKRKLQFGYGCQFMELKPQAEAELRSFTFRRERQLYRRD